MEKEVKSVIKNTSIGIAAVAVLSAGFMSTYTVDEGYVGIVKRWGKAVNQVDPGLHFKVPVMDVVVNIDTRTRKNVETMAVSTSEQMPAEAILSVNWTANKASILDLYKKYGSLEQFENKILDPKFRSSAKGGIAKFTAEQNINNRSIVTMKVRSNLQEVISKYPITINGLQYENIKLPANYVKSISLKQTAKNERDAEKFKLEKQGLVAQQRVNIANAERDAAKATADGEAYKIATEAKANADRITMIGEAEAKAIKLKTTALKGNKVLVEYTRALRWNGNYPHTMMGSTPNLLMNLK